MCSSRHFFFYTQHRVVRTFLVHKEESSCDASLSQNVWRHVIISSKLLIQGPSLCQLQIWKKGKYDDFQLEKYKNPFLSKGGNSFGPKRPYSNLDFKTDSMDKTDAKFLFSKESRIPSMPCLAAITIVRPQIRTIQCDKTWWQQRQQRRQRQ